MGPTREETDFPTNAPVEDHEKPKGCWISYIAYDPRSVKSRFWIQCIHPVSLSLPWLDEECGEPALSSGRLRKLREEGKGRAWPSVWPLCVAYL